MRQSNSCRGCPIRAGDSVTAELREWHDGSPVANWPQPENTGLVRCLERQSGLVYAVIEYPSRVTRELTDRLTKVEVTR